MKALLPLGRNASYTKRYEQLNQEPSSDKMRKKRTQQVFRVVLLVGTAISLFFVPWLLVKAWILPLPDTVQEQLDEAIGHGFVGMIVFHSLRSKQ